MVPGTPEIAVGGPDLPDTAPPAAPSGLSNTFNFGRAGRPYDVIIVTAPGGAPAASTSGSSRSSRRP
jgi:hypothetical protein